MIDINNTQLDEESKQKFEFYKGLAIKIKEQIYTESIINKKDLISLLTEVYLNEPTLLSYNYFVNLKLFFDLLEHNTTPNLRSFISNCLSKFVSKISCFKLDASQYDQLKYIFEKYVLQDFKESNKEAIFACKYLSVKFINSIFDYHDHWARLMNIIATSSINKFDIIEESIKGLNPLSNISSKPSFLNSNQAIAINTSNFKFPSFVSLLDLFIEKIPDINSSLLHNCLYTCYTYLLKFLIMNAVQGKDTCIVINLEWENNVDKAFDLDANVRQLVKSHLNLLLNTNNGIVNKSNPPPLIVFLNLIFKEYFNFENDDINLTSINSSDLENIFTYGTVFNNILSLSPPIVSSYFIPNEIDKLLNFLAFNPNSNNAVSNQSRTNNILKILQDDLVLLISKTTGLLISRPQYSDQKIKSIVKNIVNEIPIIKNEFQDSFSLRDNQIFSVKLTVLAFILSRCFALRRFSVVSLDDLLKILNFYSQLMDYNLKKENKKYYENLLEGLDQLAIYGVLNPLYSQDNHLEYTEDPFKEIYKKLCLTVKITVKRLHEKSVVTFSYLSLAYESILDTEKIIDFPTVIFNANSLKKPEFGFFSGEALTVVAWGWNSNLLNKSIDLQEVDIEDLKILVPKVLDSKFNLVLSITLNSCSKSKPSLRKAACLWLLSLVKYCGNHTLIKQNAKAINLAFMRFLAERDELIQESASIGLSLIYELGDSDLRESLVKGLLKSFTDSTAAEKLSAGSVNEDTELFEPGILKTSDGSISTYKDILNLASEVGDPSLVYKFMSLAKNSTLWSSRKGIAFGLGALVTKANLDDLLKSNSSLIPKLYRYRFDANESVSKTMNDMWNILITDSSKTILSHHDIIFNELVRGMGSREWRVRQASCIALIDLLEVLPLEVYEPKLELIWTMSFRSMDDIKDSVRNSGAQLTKFLVSNLTRITDIPSGASSLKSERILKKVIPFLLGNRGLLSDAEEIKTFALKTIFQLCEKSVTALKPFLPNLIGEMISMMTLFEPQVVNYLALNAEKYDTTALDIDNQRLQAVYHSPIMKSIDQMLDVADDKMMKDIILHIIDSIKKSVGFPSKVGSCKIIVTLISRHLELTRPYGEVLLKASTSQLKHRNETIREGYAQACGYVCRICSTDTVAKYAVELENMYLKFDSVDQRRVAAIASEFVGTYAPSSFSSVASAFLPLAYIGKHDPDKDVKDSFNKVWTDHTAGSGAIKLYIEEICTLAKKCLNSQSYFIKKVGAESISNALKAISHHSKDNPLSSQNTLIIFQLLIETSTGRSWKGKESILAALVTLCRTNHQLVLSTEGLYDRLQMIMISESKRKNREYKEHAVIALCQFAELFPSDTIYQELVNICEPLLDDEYFKEEDDDDNDNNIGTSVDRNNKGLPNDIQSFKKSSAKNLKLEQFKNNTLKSLSNSFKCYDEKFSQPLFMLILKSVERFFESKVVIITWRTQIAVCDSFSKLIETLLSSKQSLSMEEIEFSISSWNTIFFRCCNKAAIENVRLQAVRSSSKLLKLLNALKIENHESFIIEKMNKMRAEESSSVVKVEIDTVLYKH
ncbi:Ecm29p [Ascoidea rubescens DSM 1968]|uniref:ARM repeat-containing protein n=1 Tax=Ascoidea rubescens DSM 1968 TaxID=1344418 RepID=A0A1D2VGV7_9ASCO|nr:ARM repeat-containing protein [Ascoidea rubescens DSM 1968]ODV60780.1 ARM repeat-containing protein [Ascoidea rubescens DSM 1968]